MAHSKLIHQPRFAASEKLYLDKLILFIIVILRSLVTGHGQVVYVDAAATGSNNRASWANAFC